MKRIINRLKISLRKCPGRNVLLIVLSFVLGCLLTVFFQLDSILNYSLDQMRDKLEVKLTLSCEESIFHSPEYFNYLQEGMERNRQDLAVKQVDQKMIFNYTEYCDENGCQIGAILAVSDDSYFQENGIRLSVGSFFDESDYQSVRYSILVSDQSGYAVGERIEFDLAGEIVGFEVIGRFQDYRINYDFSMSNSEFFRPQSYIIPLPCALDILQRQRESGRFDAQFDEIRITLNDYLDFERVYQENRKLCFHINEGFASLSKTNKQDYCVLTSNRDEIETTLKPMRSLRTLISYVMLLMCALTYAVFILIMILIIRKRKKEIAILLSMGEKKSHIFCQFILEVLILCLIGCLLASLVSLILTPQMIRFMIDANLSYQKELSRIGNVLRNFDFENQKQILLAAYQKQSKLHFLVSSCMMISVLSCSTTAVLLGLFGNQSPRKLFQREE